MHHYNLERCFCDHRCSSRRGKAWNSWQHPPRSQRPHNELLACWPRLQVPCPFPYKNKCIINLVIQHVDFFEQMLIHVTIIWLLLNRPSFNYILKRNLLDHIIIDAVIKDPMGQSFWKKYYVEQVTPFITITVQHWCEAVSFTVFVSFYVYLVRTW